MTSMFDSHCHLQMPVFAGDLPEVLQRAKADGLEGSVIIGMDVPSSRQAVDLAARDDLLYAAVGMHPHDASCLDAEALEALRAMAREPRVVAIGETGLDFYRNLSAPELQRKAFREQLALAAELDLPVVIHSRQAQDETFAILREWATGQQRERPLGVLHCFAGDIDLAQRYILLGFMISFAGNVTYPNGRRLQEVAARAPIEQLVVETDCPFLPPQSRRGRRCEPVHMRETLEFIADKRNSSFEELAAATTANARRLYRLDGKERAA